ncbi:MAG: hypothetical protein ACFFF4_19070 [Candidatus Thorarchaeota archaeon]
MERFGFDRIRETDEEIDNRRRLEAAIKHRESLERREQEDLSIEERVSKVLDSHEARENESRGELTDEAVEQIIREVKAQSITEEERARILEECARECPLPETIENTAHLNNIERFKEGLDNHPELRFRKRFNEELQDVEEFYENEDNGGIPYLVREIGHREVHRLYEEVNDGSPNVEIESMDDVNRLLEKYPSERERMSFWTQYRTTEIYFEVREDQTKMQKELAEEYEISQQRISDYQRGIETTLISNLRRREENAIVNEWVKSDLSQYLETRELLEKESVTEIPEGNALQKIESLNVRKHLEKSLENNSIDEYVICISEAHRELSQSEARVGYIDASAISTDSKQLSKLAEIARLNRESIEVNIREQVGLELSDKSIRVGITAERVYIWRPDLTPNDMINAWGDQYFYFKTSDLARILTEVGKQLEMGENDYERLAHYNELIKQVVSDKNMDQISLKENVTRISGDNLHLLSDMMGVSPRVYEDRIFKAASSNGQSCIFNPKILNGERMEELRADFIATVLSDCALSKEGRLKYYEENLDRIDIVIKHLNEFGETNVNLRYLADDNLYEMTFPRPFGKAALYWKVPHGDKTVLNPEMPIIIENGSLSAIRCYYGGVIPEEGSVEDRVLWNRSNVVDAGIKSEEYEFESRISEREKQLIISKGRREPNDLEGKVFLRWSDILRIKKSNTPDSNVAEELSNTILENPNNLMQSEKRIAKRLGVNIRIIPDTIAAYEKTGRVSVKWKASTKRIEDTIRLGILCPLNDVRKREKMKNLLLKNQDLVEEICEDFKRRDFDFDEWWMISEE